VDKIYECKFQPLSSFTVRLAPKTGTIYLTRTVLMAVLNGKSHWCLFFHYTQIQNLSFLLKFKNNGS
jgi:hypothetical protein